jgi:ABC-type lipoprotein export system ATPase subunit
MEIKLSNLEPLSLRGECAGSEIWNRELVVHHGAQVLVRAPSGKGKTTFLSLLYGLRTDYRGQVWLGGKNLRLLKASEWSKLRQTSVSMVFQDLQLFDDLTAYENVALKNRLTHHKSREEIATWFAQMGIGGKMGEPAGRLSLGQKQRVAIIRGLCQPFQLLLLDEPFSHLDAENAQVCWTLIREECRKHQAGLVMTILSDQALSATAVYFL